MDSPYILKETEDYAVVFKPPKMHCTGNFATSKPAVSKIESEKESGKIEEETLHEWFAQKCPSVFDIMHRLDFETQGLVLFAKNEKSYSFFKAAQDRGEFIKEYSALCIPCLYVKSNEKLIEGFPEIDIKKYHEVNHPPFFVESYFRPFGPGRKQVRPVIDDLKKHKEIAKDKGGFYKTEIIKIEEQKVLELKVLELKVPNQYKFTVRIKRGFRHQIRCHLFWIGFPILNDPIYSCLINTDEDKTKPLALRSHALIFPDLSCGKMMEYRLDSI